MTTFHSDWFLPFISLALVGYCLISLVEWVRRGEVRLGIVNEKRSESAAVFWFWVVMHAFVAIVGLMVFLFATFRIDVRFWL